MYNTLGRNWRKRILVLMVLLTLCITIVAYLFYNRINNFETNEVNQSLQSTSYNNARSVEFAMDRYINFLILSADYFVKTGSEEVSFFDDVFNNLEEIENFHHIAIVLPNGESYQSNGERLIKSDYLFTAEMQEGTIHITDVFQDNTGVQVISINVPMFDEDQNLLAYLMGVMTTGELSKVFNESFYDNGGYYHVIDSNGRYVAVSNSDEMIGMDMLFQDALLTLNFDDGYSATSILDDFKNRSTGKSHYTSQESQSRIAHYTPIFINDWVMYSVVDTALVENSVSYILLCTFSFLSVSLLTFVILLLITNHAQKQVVQNAQENENKFKLVSAYLNKFFIDINFETKELKFIGEFAEVFSRPKAISNYMNDLKDEFIHPEDASELLQSLNQVKRGDAMRDYHVRVLAKDKRYIWCALTLIPSHFDSTFQVTHAIGFIEDINEQTIKSNELIQKSELDLLSQLFNKVTTENKIKEILKQSSPNHDKHILFIIDLDNFKELNDTFGHHYGDEVIKEHAKIIKQMFRPNDIVGRIGGDEFFVLMKSIESSKQVHERATMICEALRKTYTSGGKSVSISASVGISSFPNDGLHFDILYQRADLALYTAKKQGKDSFEFYLGQTEANYKSKRTTIESDSTKYKA